MYHAKIRDRYSTMIEYENEPFLQGIFIDIFPMDILSKNMKKAKKELLLSIILYMMRYWMRASDRWYFLLVKRSLYFMGKLIPKALIDRKIQKMKRRHILEKESHISYGLDSFLLAIFQYSDLFPLKTMEFEGHIFPVPAKPENILKVQFGKNYMEPPPESKRKPHAQSIDPFHGHGHKENLDWESRMA